MGDVGLGVGCEAVAVGRVQYLDARNMREVFVQQDRMRESLGLQPASGFDDSVVVAFWKNEALRAAAPRACDEGLKIVGQDRLILVRLPSARNRWVVSHQLVKMRFTRMAASPWMSLQMLPMSTAFAELISRQQLIVQTSCCATSPVTKTSSDLQCRSRHIRAIRQRRNSICDLG